MDKRCTFEYPKLHSHVFHEKTDNADQPLCLLSPIPERNCKQGNIQEIILEVQYEEWLQGGESLDPNEAIHKLTDELTNILLKDGAKKKTKRKTKGKHKHNELDKLHNKARKMKTKIGKTGRGEERDKLINDLAEIISEIGTKQKKLKK